MKSSYAHLRLKPIYSAFPSLLTPALAAAALTVALSPHADAQARQAQPGYVHPTFSTPSYAPSVSRPVTSVPTTLPTRPTFTPSAPSFSRPAPTVARPVPGYAPTIGSLPGVPNTSSLSGLSNRMGMNPGLFFQNNNPPMGNPPANSSGNGTRPPIAPGRVPVVPPANQITRTNPGTINNLLSHNVLNFNRFNNTAESNRYRFGVPNRGRYYYGGYSNFGYFADGLAYYPYYSPYFAYGYTTLSPYAFYYGSFPPFITLGGVYSQPPQYVYVPYPVYQNGNYQGYQQDDVDNYYLNRNSNGNYRVGENAPKPATDTAFEAALTDIREAWKSSKLDPLAKHVRRDARVAIYLRGKYQYSMDAGDYLDMTRDALAATKTVSFTLDNIQRKQKDVYTVTGRHVYRDKDGNSHTVLVTYVLEKADNDYIITQVGSAPEKVEE